MSPRARPKRLRGGKAGFEPRGVCLEREHRAWKLHVLRRTQREIATELGVSQGAVSKILRRVKAHKNAEMARDIALLIASHDLLFREAHDGYLRSQTDATRQRQRQTLNADGSRGPTRVEVETHSRDGDPAFLEQARRALEQAAFLLGLTGRGGGARGGSEPDPTADRERLTSRLARLAAKAASDPVDGDPE